MPVVSALRLNASQEYGTPGCSEGYWRRGPQPWTSSFHHHLVSPYHSGRKRRAATDTQVRRDRDSGYSRQSRALDAAFELARQRLSRRTPATAASWHTPNITGDNACTRNGHVLQIRVHGETGLCMRRCDCPWPKARRGRSRVGAAFPAELAGRAQLRRISSSSIRRARRLEGSSRAGDLLLPEFEQAAGPTCSASDNR